METMQEWASYYQKLRVWVYPGYLPFKWLDWRKLNDKVYLEKAQTYDWNRTKYMMLVVGKKGTRAIKINWSYKSALSNVLTILGLPLDYLWIINNTDYYIIVDSPNLLLGGIKAKTDKFEVIWEAGIQIPSDTSSCLCFLDTVPDKHPNVVSNDTIKECISKLSKESFWKKYKKKEPINTKGCLTSIVTEHETRKIGCGCATFIPPLIAAALLESGQLHGFWGITLALMVVVMSFLIGAFVTGLFD